jgi:hypothetical protein
MSVHDPEKEWYGIWRLCKPDMILGIGKKTAMELRIDKTELGGSGA